MPLECSPAQTDRQMVSMPVLPELVRERETGAAAEALASQQIV